MMASPLDRDLFAACGTAPEAGLKAELLDASLHSASTDYWRGYELPSAMSAQEWRSPEEQHSLVVAALDKISECPCCGALMSRKEWADGRMIAGPNFRGYMDTFRWRNDALSVKFECGLFLAAEENVCLSAHQPCLTGTRTAVEQIFEAALADKDGVQ